MCNFIPWPNIECVAKLYKIFSQIHAAITTDSFHSNKSTFIPVSPANFKCNNKLHNDKQVNATTTTTKKENPFENAITVHRTMDSLKRKCFVVCANCEKEGKALLLRQQLTHRDTKREREKKRPSKAPVSRQRIFHSTQSFIFVCVVHSSFQNCMKFIFLSWWSLSCYLLNSLQWVNYTLMLLFCYSSNILQQNFTSKFKSFPPRDALDEF